MHTTPQAQTDAETTQPLKLVMFDLDGTLIETAPEIADAVNDTLQLHGLPSVSLAQVRDWIGHGTHELLLSALATGLATPVASVRTWSELPQVSADFGQAYAHRCGTRSHLYPHVREVLHALAAQGVRLVVVTNKEARFTQVVLQAHGLVDSFDLVISGDTLPTKKPHPGAIAHCLERFQLQAHQALFIGDSSIDAATARNAGVQVWLLPYGYNMGEPIEAAQPDRVIPDLSALFNLVSTSA